MSERYERQAWGRRRDTPYAPRIRGKVCIACGAPAANHHHVLGAQHLRRWAREQRGWERKERPYKTQAVLKDDRNLVPMCFPCHMDHEAWARRLTRDQVPASTWEFARELGEWAVVRLERDYPVRGDTAGPAGAHGA